MFGKSLLSLVIVAGGVAMTVIFPNPITIGVLGGAATLITGNNGILSKTKIIKEKSKERKKNKEEVKNLDIEQNNRKLTKHLQSIISQQEIKNNKIHEKYVPEPSAPNLYPRPKTILKTVQLTYIIKVMNEYNKKEIRDMNVMELIEKISETTKIAALNLWGTDRERTNIAIDECAQKMKNIRLLADKSKLQDALDNIGIALRVMEMLTETNDMKIANQNVKDIVSEMLDSDDESLTSDGDESCPTCDSD